MKQVGSVLALASAVFACLIVGWFKLIDLTGGETSECDRGDCGALGEFTFARWPLFLLAVFAVATALAYGIVRARR